MYSIPHNRISDIRPTVPAQPSRPLDQQLCHMRDGGDAWKTEKTHIHWIVRFIRFLGKQHPAALLARRVEQCLSHLANGRPSSPATQRIALNALAYLYVGFPGVKLDSQ